MTFDAIIKNFYEDIDYINYSKKNSYNRLNSYKISEESNNIIFKCLAPGMNKEDIDISFDRKKLLIKSKQESGDKDFKTIFNDSISLYKSINVEDSFAEISKGILTITMPIKIQDCKKTINFI